ncbi:MAG: efflux RND transporter periplasmic adaptor subunit [Candidatus Eisenbacteria bacterium]|nr:efflux RND transporter periplasmic adaptor subunit [Candidatus Latescibacterota bacterium]MBD3302313.1 efflux RND transporter periplasmic adaptor subunit [Candidatus Eisenbacteria bacterium]
MTRHEERKSAGRGRWILLVLAVFAVGLVAGSWLFGGGEAPPADAPMQRAHDHEEEATVWTCSMHPQIKLPEEGKCPICFMDLIPLESDSGEESPVRLQMSEAAIQLAEIETAPVVRQDLETRIRLSGKVAVDERRVKRITAWVPGRLERLFVDFTGSVVDAGDPLVEIYSPDLYSAQVELLQAIRARSELAAAGAGVLRETAESTVAAAREKLQLLGLTEAQIAAIEERGAASERITIHAPIGGTVVHKNAVEGAYVETGTPIYTIADLSRVWVMLDAYESDLTWVDEGDEVEFRVEALPGETFTGTVAFVDPVVDPGTRAVTVRLDAANPARRLKPEMFVRSTIEANADGEPQLAIPATAPLITGKRAVVYVRVPDTEKPTFEGREVVLGPRAGDLYAVRSGLEEGERVVVEGAFKIDSEMQIRAKPSMMNPPEEESSPEEEPGDEGPDPRIAALREAPDRFVDALRPLLGAYLTVQRALAADDATATRAALAEVEKTLAAVDATALAPKAREAWMEITGSIRAGLEEAADTEDLATIRAGFEPISEAVILLERAFGPPTGEIHRLAYCPMAFENEGAYWIQTEEEISNPYFGEMMLRCGSIEETFGGADR